MSYAEALERLKIWKRAQDGTDKTDETPSQDGCVSFVSRPSGPFSKTKGTKDPALEAVHTWPVDFQEALPELTESFRKAGHTTAEAEERARQCLERGVRYFRVIEGGRSREAAEREVYGAPCPCAEGAASEATEVLSVRTGSAEGDTCELPHPRHRSLRNGNTPRSRKRQPNKEHQDGEFSHRITT